MASSMTTNRYWQPAWPRGCAVGAAAVDAVAGQQDSSQFLAVDVHELAGTLALVSHNLGARASVPFSM